MAKSVMQITHLLGRLHYAKLKYIMIIYNAKKEPNIFNIKLLSSGFKMLKCSVLS